MLFKARAQPRENYTPVAASTFRPPRPPHTVKCPVRPNIPQPIDFLSGAEASPICSAKGTRRAPTRRQPRLENSIFPPQMGGETEIGHEWGRERRNPALRTPRAQPLFGEALSG